MAATNTVPASYTTSDAEVGTAGDGQRAHVASIAHTARLERKLWAVRPGVWCYVGNGLSNQTFVEGPDGLIAIDTGESVEEMADALEAVQEHTDAPVAAVIYTHFHYVNGTSAVVPAGTDVPIWGHERIVGNLQRYGFELSAAAGRGLVHQFGIQLPHDGPDGIVNVGLGLEFRRASHAPFTPGFIPPTHTLSEPTTVNIAGLQVEMTPAPSDADDNITIWFPELGTCVNNSVWPTLFNVFAIRGEEYRDPRVLLTGLDHIASLGAEHLVGAHGPPLSGTDEIAATVIDYRDSIQFLWDQTVRGINKGLTMDELTSFVQIPERFDRTYLTQQFYGLVEHHVRQIHNGLRGWFDGDEAKLLPLPPADRCQRLIDGFGGLDNVRAQAQAAIDDGDYRWAIELASWLVRREVDDRTGRADGGTPEDRALLAATLRAVGHRTTAANVRNWCLTRALELEGSIDVSRLRTHRFAMGAVKSNPPEVSVQGLRVIVDPQHAAGVHTEMRWRFADGTTTGLRVRDGVALPTSGADADLEIALSIDTWASLLATKLTLGDALESGAISTEASPGALAKFFACFEHATLAALA